MSLLKNQLSAFKSSIKDQSQFAQSRRVVAPVVPVAIASPPPSTSQPSTPDPSGNNLKRKRPVKQNVVYSQPADTGMGTYIMTQVLYIVQHLKDKEVPLTAMQIESYMSLRLDDTMSTVLKTNERVVYDPKHDTYAFKPIHDIRNAQQLLGYLQRMTTAQGLSVKELKDGWSGALDTIDDLEASGDILVTRTKKDGQPRMVWINDKTLNVNVDPEFTSIWDKITIPPPAELPAELEKARLKPTSVDPATIKKTMQAEKKKQKKPRRGRITNTHLAGILKEY